MAVGAQVDTRRPLTVAKEGGEVTVVKNIGTPTVYYKTGQTGSSVSSSLNDGSLASGKSLTLTQTTYFIATEGGAQVELVTRTIGGHPEEGGGQVELAGLPNLKEFGARGDGVTDDTSAINTAIGSLIGDKTTGPNGGAIYCPPGVYVHEGEPNFKEKANIRLIGAGALVAAGAIGTNRPNIGATVFIYSGAGSRGWDFRSQVGCGLENIHCFAWGSGFTGPIWDLSGTEAQPGILSHFVNSTVEATRVGGKASEEILACKGALLDYSNGYVFDSCIFSGCEYGVQGINNAAHSSVAHRFNSCFFAGNQKLHVANPQEAWEFNSCIAESLFNRKGEILNRAGFIGYSGAGFKSLGLNLNNCWTGSNVPASREGANVTFIGEGLNVQGGSYNTGEIGVFFKEGCVGNTIQGARFWKLNNSVYAEGAKTKDSIIAANRHTEIANSPPVGGTAEGKEYLGCIIQEDNAKALKVS